MRVYSSPSALAASLRRQREGLALRALLLYLAAACFLAECFLANYLIPRERVAAVERSASAASSR